MEEEEESSLQAKGAAGQTPEDTPNTQTQINDLRGGGQLLPESARAFFEPRFGRDFSQVRVHTDARAAESARAVNALAYTVGDQMVFGAGRYDPTTWDGARLLAHELTHAVQQGSTGPISDGKRPGGANSAAGMEPDRGAATIVAETGAWIVKGTSPLTIARFSDTGHHAIEEAALAGAGFSEPKIAGIERGNIERDCSQPCDQAEIEADQIANRVIAREGTAYEAGPTVRRSAEGNAPSRLNSTIFAMTSRRNSLTRVTFSTNAPFVSIIG